MQNSRNKTKIRSEHKSISSMSVSNISGFFGKIRNNLTDRYAEELPTEKTKIKVIVRIRPYLELDRQYL